MAIKGYCYYTVKFLRESNSGTSDIELTSPWKLGQESRTMTLGVNESVYILSAYTFNILSIK
jgi:hypothetical protein